MPDIVASAASGPLGPEAAESASLSSTPESLLGSFAPDGILTRRGASWRGAMVEAIETTRREPFGYAFRGRSHLLIAHERFERSAGQTVVEGLPPSARHSLTGKLTFVPAGREIVECSTPRTLTRRAHVYLDPSGPLLAPELGFDRVEFAPRLDFADVDLWETVVKLQSCIAAPGPADRLYAETLGMLLAHELLRLNGDPAHSPPKSRGRLAGWQEAAVADYIEAHLAEPIALGRLAAVAGLSPFHFARAFKETFGMPPHRYHIARRIARAKQRLAERDVSVTSIAMELGFAETSSFGAAFRKLTGRTPSDYREDCLGHSVAVADGA